MRKLILMALFVFAAAPFTFAQSTDDYNKVDVFVGFSHNRIDTGIDDNDPDFDDIVDEREGFNGFNASVAGNISRYVGLKGDYSFHRKSFRDEYNIVCVTAPCPPNFTVDVDSDIHNLVGGVQFKDNAKGTKVRPFAHLMAGLVHARFDVEGVPSSVGTNFEDSESGFSGIIGGGIDFRVNDRVDIRAIQFDYNPTRLDNAMQHNFRVGVGVVFR